MSDFLHPNVDQYPVWAEAIEPPLKKSIIRLFSKKQK